MRILLDEFWDRLHVFYRYHDDIIVNSCDHSSRLVKVLYCESPNLDTNMEYSHH